MRIAQLAALWKEIPPKKYGGTEVIESLLTEGLVDAGHDVTLFASGDSHTKANHISIVEKNYFDLFGEFNWADISLNILNCVECFGKSKQFDVIHTHMMEGLLFADFVDTPVVFTCHSSLPPDSMFIANKVQNKNFISISMAQRELFPKANWIANVHHGIDIEPYIYVEKPEDYIFFMGTISHFKGADTALQVSMKTKIGIKLAGDHRKDFAEFEKRDITPFINGTSRQLIGEVAMKEKLKLFGSARVFILPIRWVEAFGLVMIESMACGTPVVAFANGSVPELIEDGITGFIVNESPEKKKGDWIIKKTGVEGLCEAVERINAMPEQEYINMRKQSRKRVEDNFTYQHMVMNYEVVYESLL